MPGILEELEVVQHGWSITSMKNGKNSGKEDQDPDAYMALPDTEQGTCLRPICCPLGAYSYNNTRWGKHHNVQIAKC